jgi:hypothetical protein
MDHDQAIETKFPMRYVLQELTPADRDEFEEHLADCSNCMNEVWMATAFAANAKEVFRAEGTRQIAPEHAPWWSRFGFGSAPQWIPVAACVLLAATVGYQNLFEIRGLRAKIGRLDQPQVLTSTPIVPPSSRGSIHLIEVPSDASFFQLPLATDVVEPGRQYQCELRSKSGNIIWSAPLPASPPNEPLRLLIPTSRVSKGEYIAVLLERTPSGALERERYSFVVSLR